jgi:hypothetical protein
VTAYNALDKIAAKAIVVDVRSRVSDRLTACNGSRQIANVTEQLKEDLKHAQTTTIAGNEAVFQKLTDSINLHMVIYTFQH